jgi:tRNA(adenine34) deaminase
MPDHPTKARLSRREANVEGARVYVTVEPCLMCVGALVHARVREVVYGVDVVGGVCEDECRQLMQAFFKDRQ